MADALVSIAVGKVTQVLGQQLALVGGPSTHELRRLQKTFQHIKAVLQDAERKQLVPEEHVRLWLLELRQVAYDIDDLLEDWIICGFEKDESSDEDEDADAGNRICALAGAPCLHLPCTCLDRTISRYKFAREIKEIRKRLDEIAKDRDQFNTSQMGGGSSSSNFGGEARPVIRRSRTMTSSYMNELMLGRDDDRDTVISWLISGSSSGEYGQQQVHVIAIVGIGGLGKTTLVRQVYNDSKVQDHFKGFLYWVCVSEDFDLRRLLKAIIEQVKGVGTSLIELDSLQNELVRELRGKRFLLVLDDVWNDDKSKWNALQPCLENGAPGSRIVVTTRLQKVAATTMNAAHIHELKGLSEDHSWTLFSSIAFDGWTAEECSNQLESVGRQIVHNCKGVPLSITVMGSVMNSKRTVKDWQNILDSNMWSLPEAENKILPALWLSYYNLPPCLKQCFVYCSIYPKDQKMCKDDLVKLWIAQGFIESQGNRETEDIGAEYVDDLVAWSMFQQQVDKGGEIKYTVHDLLHDLAKFIAKDEIYSFFSSEGGVLDECSSDNVRHALLHFGYKPNTITSTFSRGKKLRTLMINELNEANTTIVDLFHQARFLRALVFHHPRALPKTICQLRHLRFLDVSYSKTRYLPNAVGQMKQLRYLKLSHSGIVMLPESVSRLHNLCSLGLNGCVKLKRLPRRMGEMTSLRHLEIEGTNSLEHLPKGLGRISCLQSLHKFIVGGGDEGEGCGIDELQLLNSLQGSLQIEHLEKVSSREEAEKAQLWNKQNLRRLVLYMSDHAGTEGTVNVLEGLQPHADLEELELKCYTESSKLKLPSWIEDSSFYKLTKLKLAGFISYCEPKSLPGIGKLPALKSLRVMNVGIRKLGSEFYFGSSSSCDVISAEAFLKLEEVCFSRLNEWEEWELMRRTVADDTGASNKGIMPSLRKLKLSHCSKLEGLPHHLASAPLKSLAIDHCNRIEGGSGCSSFPFLEEFTLLDSSQFLSSGLPNLFSLRKFTIDLFRNERLPDEGWEQLVSLQKLKIVNCFGLKSLPERLTQLGSLEDLEISSCHELESLPERLGQLKKLKLLRIYDLQTLTALPDSLGQLEALEDLRIQGLEKLQLLPHESGQLQKLKSLEISCAASLTCLPDSLGQLESLEYLHISSLKKLESLPHSLEQLKALNHLQILLCKALGSLPPGLQSLSLLRRLWISGCPLLSETCKMEGGVDWPNISHIPHIIIDE